MPTSYAVTTSSLGSTSHAVNSAGAAELLVVAAVVVAVGVGDEVRAVVEPSAPPQPAVSRAAAAVAANFLANTSGALWAVEKRAHSTRGCPPVRGNVRLACRPPDSFPEPVARARRATHTSAADVRSATSASTAPATAAASGLSDSCTKRDEVTRVPEYSKIPWSIATRIDSS